MFTDNIKVLGLDEIDETIRVFVEWVAIPQDDSFASLTFEAVDAGGNVLEDDEIRLFPFTSTLIFLGGACQGFTPQKKIETGGICQWFAPWDADEMGLFKYAIELRNEGYDARVFWQDDERGQWEEVEDAVGREVDKIAIVGYSQGGGATWALASEINQLKPGEVDIAYTAYIDGSESGSFGVAITDRPPGSGWHDNYYQRGAFSFLAPGLLWIPTLRHDIACGDNMRLYDPASNPNGANFNLNVKDDDDFWGIGIGHEGLDDNRNIWECDSHQLDCEFNGKTWNGILWQIQEVGR